MYEVLECLPERLPLSSNLRADTGMRYLTVQDMLWVHTLTSGETAAQFDYIKLEEACYYQYGYGTSRDLAGQAARFLHGFQKLAPFAHGNEASAFVGFAAFLAMNGHVLKGDDSGAEKLVRQAAAGPIDSGALPLAESHAHGEVDVRDAVAEVFERYPKTIASLGKAVAKS